MKNRWINAALGTGAALGASGLGSALLGRRNEAAVPRDGGIIEAGGAQLHYLDRGRGRPVVMVHGLAGQLRNFTFALTERLDDARLVAVDRPGSGFSPVHGRHPGLVEQGRIVAALIERLGLERPLIVGHSFGGAVALAAALERPDLVGGLALVAPLTQPMERPPAMFAALALPPAPIRAKAARWLGVPLATLGRRWTQPEIFAPDPIPDDFDVRGGGLLALRPSAIESVVRDMEAAQAEMPALASRHGTLDLPVEILFGRGDRVLDPALHGEAAAAAIPGARLTMVEGGHVLPVTRPDETATFVRASLARMG